MGHHHQLLPAVVRTPRRPLLVVGLSACLGALLGLVAASSAGATQAVTSSVFVAPGGSDSAAGTSAHPLRTISAAASRTPNNAVIIVGSGTYHESVTLEGKSGRTIKAAPGASVWLDGSKVVSNWRVSGSRWIADNWTARFDSSATFTKGAPDNASPNWRFVNPAHPMAAHPDQVWVDGSTLQQVATAAAVRPGTFYVDYPTSRLYLGSNPAGHEVRASDLSKAISIRDPNTTISGINVRRFAPSVPTMGAVTVERPNATLAHMQITDNATTGLQVGRSGVRLTSLLIARNGMNGLLGSHADGLRIRGITVTKNNLERFNPSPSAGGVKLGRSRDISVRDSQFLGNYGTGLWFDESVYNFGVFGSKIRDNTGNGLALEISGTGRVANNVITSNGGDGLKINDTDRVRVWNNSLIDNGRAVNIGQDRRDVDIGQSYRDRSLPLTLRSERIVLHNNILSQSRATANCLLCVEDHSHRFSARQLKIRADGNVYQRPSASRPKWLVVWSKGPGNPAVFTTLKQSRRATGQEHRGREITGTSALTAALRPTARVTRLVTKTAYRAPSWLAASVGVKPGRKHLGSWRN